MGDLIVRARRESGQVRLFKQVEQRAGAIYTSISTAKEIFSKLNGGKWEHILTNRITRRLFAIKNKWTKQAKNANG